MEKLQWRARGTLIVRIMAEEREAGDGGKGGGERRKQGGK